MTPAVLAAIADTTKSLVQKLFSLKGKTAHLSYNDAASVAGPLANSMCQIIDASVPVSIVDAYRDRIPREFADRIYFSGWWNKGNNQQADVVPNLNSISNLADSIQLSFSGLFVWAIRNAPSDNMRDAYSAITKVLSTSINTYLDQNSLHDTVVQIDSTIAAALGQTGIMGGSLDSSTSPPKVISDILGKIKSFLYPSETTTTSGTTTKAGFSTIAIVILVGAALGLILFFFKKKK